MSPPPTLPPDLITEILSWLPVMFLVRFKCVCKFWKSLISNPTFAKLHLERSPKNTHVLLTLTDVVNISNDNNDNIWVVTPYSVPRLLEHPSVIVNEDDCRRINADAIIPLSSTNGLVYLVGFNSEEQGFQEIWVWFWNPTLRLRSEMSPTLTVPSYRRRPKVHLGSGYDDLSDTYK
ncbi:F-box/kelch-repeat protein, partial [Trifolium medium]|nr:F-box/kelch-repeat protein [Trifolium medium]